MKPLDNLVLAAFATWAFGACTSSDNLFASSDGASGSAPQGGGAGHGQGGASGVAGGGAQGGNGGSGTGSAGGGGVLTRGVGGGAAGGPGGDAIGNRGGWDGAGSAGTAGSAGGADGAGGAGATGEAGAAGGAAGAHGPEAGVDAPTNRDAGTDRTYVDSPSPDCAATAESSLPGASIRITASQCSFSLAEAAAGIQISYEVVVTQALEVVPLPEDGCGDHPDASGLTPFEQLSGSGQQYCLCDVGRCSDLRKATILVPGATSHAFTWTGRNWNGPSDTLSPLRDPFPAGTYLLDVFAKGSIGDDAKGNPFEVRATATITLVP